MQPVPYILRLVDTSERFSRHHLWDGPRCGGVPYFNGRRAVLRLWELKHGEHIPFRYTLINECGYLGCVRLDHFRLGTLSEALRAALRRRMERHLAAIEAA